MKRKGILYLRVAVLGAVKSCGYGMYLMNGQKLNLNMGRP